MLSFFCYLNKSLWTSFFIYILMNSSVYFWFILKMQIIMHCCLNAISSSRISYLFMLIKLDKKNNSKKICNIEKVINGSLYFLHCIFDIKYFNFHEWLIILNNFIKVINLKLFHCNVFFNFLNIRKTMINKKT